MTNYKKEQSSIKILESILMIFIILMTIHVISMPSSLIYAQDGNGGNGGDGDGGNGGPDGGGGPDGKPNHDDGKDHDGRDRDHDHDDDDDDRTIIKKYYREDDDDDNDIADLAAYNMGYRDGRFDKLSNMPFSDLAPFDDNDAETWYKIGYRALDGILLLEKVH